ncbi:MAG: hypothetical protein IPH84_03625 [Bacteroidales bacterium]|nr:hypothetical protein [Bacteroidales bacterium]
MLNKLKLFLFAMVVVFSNLVLAQEGTPVACSDPLVQQAVSQLETSLKSPEGELYQFAVENNLKGTFVFDISIRKKGEVATVFVVSSENASIPMQNLLKDRIKTFKFKLVIPKKTTYKFRYTFMFT